MDQNLLKQLLAKSLTDKLTDTEQNQLEAMLASSELAQSIRDEETEIWQASGEIKRFYRINACQHDDYCAVLSRLRKTRKLSPVRKLYPLTNWAAAIIAITVIGSALWFLHNHVAGFGKWRAVTAHHSTLMIELPDHSSVALNKGSRLIYFTDADAKVREVRLKGEAFFDVTPDSLRSFVVNVSNAEVRVLGTSFNVNAQKAKGDVEVYVAEGRVSLGNDNQHVVLNVNETGILKNGELTKRMATNANAIFWKTGEMVFTNNTLAEVIEILNGAYDEIEQIEIRADDKETRITTKFSHQSLSRSLYRVGATLQPSIQIAKWNFNC
jgi:transmembrane sensor